MREWRHVNLGSICKLKAGSAFKKDQQGLSAGDYPFIKVSDMNLAGNEYCIRRANNWVTVAAAKQMKAALHPPDATVFAKIGVALTYNRRRRLIRHTIIDNNMMSATPKSEHVDPRFFYYLLSYVDFNTIVEGSALPYLKASTIKEVEVDLPLLSEQKAIAHILGTLDDKIELNRRMNETLEGIARAIFKSWFIDFDPVIDNALRAGNPIPSSMTERAEVRKRLLDQNQPSPGLRPPSPNGRGAGGEGATPLLTGLPKEIEDLFPDSFEDSELGEIPKGWEVSTLGENAEKISKGTTPRKNDVMNARDPEIIPFLKVKNISNRGEIDINSLSKIPQSIHESTLRRSMLRTNDVLFSIAGTIGRVSIVTDEINNSNANQAIAFVRPLEKGVPADYIRLLLLTERIQHDASSKVVQAVQANVSLSVLSGFVFPLATHEVIECWSMCCRNVFRKQQSIAKQNRALAGIREPLLAGLLSGNIPIPDIEALLEGAE